MERSPGGRIEPFRIEIDDDGIRDLRERLGRTLWPEPATVRDGSQGVPLAYLQELCRSWAQEYDWRATEARLNALPRSPSGTAPPLTSRR